MSDRHKCISWKADARENWVNYGSAVTACTEDDMGQFWASNGEYVSKVNYCPYCGVKSPVQFDADVHDTWER